MSTQQEIDQIVATARRLDPKAVAREVADLTASRVKGWSAEKVGGRSADTALPLPEALDRRVRRDHASFKRHIEKALSEIELALQCQTALLVRLTLDQAQRLLAAEAGGVPCSNCKKAVVPKSKKDKAAKTLRCRACNEYARDHGGTERPKELWSA